MNEPISKALALQTKKTEKCKRTYKYFNYAFYVHFVCFLLIFTFDKNKATDIFWGTWAVAWVVSGLAYIIFLGSLVGSANKSAIQWVGGTILFNYIGMIVSFFKMKTVAIEQGWTK